MWRRIIYHPEVNYALRQTIILALPVIFGLLLGSLNTGLLFSLVPVCCNIAGLDTPHRKFFKRLTIGALLFASGSCLLPLLLQWHVPLPIVILLLALLFGISTEISPLHSRLLPASLVASIFSLTMIDVFPLWLAPLIFLVGTCWYGFFHWFWFRLWQEQPMRETLSLLYHEIADYCEAKYSLLTQHVDPEKALPPLLQRQQEVMDLIIQLYQQINILSNPKSAQHKRLMRTFQVALDLQEHITASLHQPSEVQRLVEKSHAEAILRHHALCVAKRLRVLGDAILYHRNPPPFEMTRELSALKKLATQHPDNPVGQFCYYHFSRIGRLLKTQRPLYRRALMGNEPRASFWITLRHYLSFHSSGLRGAARTGVALAIGGFLGALLHLPKPYWIMLTIMFVSQNSYNATRVRIQHRAIGTFLGLLIAAWILQQPLSTHAVFGLMLVITFASYLVLRKQYGLAVVGFTVTAVYTLQLLTENGVDMLLPRFIDTMIGCLLAFASMLWLWPQWQSGLLRTHAHQALAHFQSHLRLLLQTAPNASELSYRRINVNQAHTTLFNSLNQAMREPGFNTRYLADMRLWVTHSQFIVEHLNAMTVLARERHALPEALANDYLVTCEITLQSCQQRLTAPHSANGDNPLIRQPEWDPNSNITLMERHLRRLLSHLYTMHTLSSIAWDQRPQHGIWLSKKLWRKHDQ